MILSSRADVILHCETVEKQGNLGFVCKAIGGANYHAVISLSLTLVVYAWEYRFTLVMFPI